ncbi:MAG: DUF6430 domain-containing protein [bacterium]
MIELRMIYDNVSKIMLPIMSLISFALSYVYYYLENSVIPLTLLIFSVCTMISIMILTVIDFYKTGKCATLKINNTTINIKFGDIFEENNNLKVIAFNEYFDTEVDDIIISSSSLNGKFIKNKIPDDYILTFDAKITKDQEKNIYMENNERNKGKKVKYKLGTMHKHGNYFLLAFSRFNEKNEANLTNVEYVKCLMEMWGNLNSNYNQKEIDIPLLGSGITRIPNKANITHQNLLEIMLYTLEISNLTFSKPSNINIILYSGDRKLYNLVKIKKEFNRGDKYVK